MLSLLPHLTTTLVKAYLPQFLLHSTSLPPFNQKLQGIPRQKTQFETQKESEPDPDIAGMLELSGHEFKTTMLSMLILGL